MALLRACVTDTPVTLRLDSKVETAGTVVLVLIPTSVAAPQEAWQSVTAPVQLYDPPLLLSSCAALYLHLQHPHLSTSFYIWGDNMPLPQR